MLCKKYECVFLKPGPRSEEVVQHCSGTYANPKFTDIHHAINTALFASLAGYEPDN